MFRIELESDKAKQALQELMDRGVNLTPAMQEISAAMLDSIEQAFANESDLVSGDTWHPLSPVTIDQRGGDAHPILQRSGRLAASYTPSFGPDFAQAGTNVIYALVQQLGAKQGEFGTTASGGPIPWGDIPARPMVGFSTEVEEEILDIVSRYLAAG